MNNLCTICMRGGSKGVPDKNLRQLNGKPLMAYTIGQALESGLFEHVVVSTDSEKIAETAKSFGAEAWFLRPVKMATDEAPKLPAIRHAFLEAEKHYDKQFDVLLDLDATSPLRNVEDIVRAYQQFIMEDADNLITACPARKNPYYNMIEISNGSIGIVKNSRLSKMLIGAKVTIREALIALSKSGAKCLIIVNSKKQLMGTLSDGDLRKAILKGMEIDKPITNLYNSNSVFLKRGAFEIAQVKNIFLENKFDLIPIVDKTGVVVDFVVWEKIFAQDEKVHYQLRNARLNKPTRRQDSPEVYDMNASIYIWKRKALLGNDSLYTDKTSLYVMPEERSVDIDSKLDWDFVEFMIYKSREIND